MITQTAQYKEITVRYTVVADNGILLNTKDVCAVLLVVERSSCGVFGEPCMDMAGVIEASFTDGRNENDFIDWLEETFRGYELRTPIRPNCDDNWNLK